MPERERDQRSPSDLERDPQKGEKVSDEEGEGGRRKGKRIDRRRKNLVYLLAFTLLLLFSSVGCLLSTGKPGKGGEMRRKTADEEEGTTSKATFFAFKESTGSFSTAVVVNADEKRRELFARAVPILPGTKYLKKPNSSKPTSFDIFFEEIHLDVLKRRARRGRELK